MIVMGAGTNHWFHSDQTYRAMLALVLFCGCQGVNGGGWAHYVGQEKVRPITGWSTVAFALDWSRPPRQQPATPFWYLASDQWRYETFGAEEFTSPAGNGVARRAPHWPTATRSPPGSAGCRRIRASTATRSTSATRRASAGVEPAEHVVSELREGRLRFACEDPDDPANFPRVLSLWRANLLGSSSKGHEYFLRHLLGVPDAAVRSERVGAGAASRRGRVARRGAGRQARPVHDARLPHERLVRLLRRRPAGGHLVREARPLEHRPAPVRPPVQRRDPAALGDEDRLGRLQPDRGRVQPACGRAPRHPHRPRRRAAAARHPRGARPAARAGSATGRRASASRSRARRCRS